MSGDINWMRQSFWFQREPPKAVWKPTNPVPVPNMTFGCQSHSISPSFSHFYFSKWSISLSHGPEDVFYSLFSNSFFFSFAVTKRNAQASAKNITIRNLCNWVTWHQTPAHWRVTTVFKPHWALVLHQRFPISHFLSLSLYLSLSLTPRTMNH